MTAALAGLYAITSRALCSDGARLASAVEQALRGGASLVQYRDKWNPPATRLANAITLAALCRRHGRRLIVNDDIELALQCGADGVHLGATDASLAAARQRLGANAILGATCGNSLQRALAAQSQGADYVAFGRFFDSTTKPDAPPAPLTLLDEARAALRVPICAIGGITPDNAGVVVSHGASLIAAVEGVFGASDIEGAARAYLNATGIRSPEPGN